MQGNSVDVCSERCTVEVDNRAQIDVSHVLLVPADGGLEAVFLCRSSCQEAMMAVDECVSVNRLGWDTVSAESTLL